MGWGRGRLSGNSKLGILSSAKTEGGRVLGCFYFQHLFLITQCCWPPAPPRGGVGSHKGGDLRTDWGDRCLGHLSRCYDLGQVAQIL